MRPLLEQPPQLPTMSPGAWGEARRDLYRGTDVLLRPGLTLRSLRGAEFVRVRRGLVVAGYIASADCKACPAVLAVSGWPIDFQTPSRDAFQCGAGSRPYVLVRPRWPSYTGRAVRQVWRQCLLQ